MIVFLLVCILVAVLFPADVRALLGCLLTLFVLALLWGLALWGMTWMGHSLDAGTMASAAIVVVLICWEAISGSNSEDNP